MKNREIAKRYIMLVVGLFFIALGIAFAKSAELGISPVSSVANVLSLRFTFLSMGTWLIITNCALTLAQIIILRRNFKLFQLLQIPVSFLVGYFTDFCMWLVSFIPADSYIARLCLLLVGVVVLGFGISITVFADVVMNSGEAFVRVLADVSHKKFGTVKTVFDVSYVTLSIILSLVLFGGRVVGTREGTLIAAVCTGFVVKFFSRLLEKPMSKLL